MKKILLILCLITLSQHSFSQSYWIDSLIIKNGSGKIIHNKPLDASINNKVDRIEFKNSNNELITLFEKTVPKLTNGTVRFISYNKSYELVFFEIHDRWIIEKYVDFTKFYHIKTISYD